MHFRLLVLAAVGGTLVACDELGELASSELATFAHPCFGNRTDTVFIDGPDTLYVGCGSTTEGTGLYRTTDAGRDWEPVEGFEAFRVNHVHRANDGVLYVAGTGPNSQRVVSLGYDGTVTPVFSAQSQTWNSFQVGTFLRLDDGSAIAESHTGSDLAYRPTADGEWVDGYGWWTGDESFQILDAVLHDSRVVGVGSTIIQPPQVFVQQDGPGFSMVNVPLGEFDGEVWGVDSDGTGLIAGGVDQIVDVGMIYWTEGGSPAEASSWKSTDLSDLFDDPSWIRGVCRDNEHLVAVGELSQLSEGILVESFDGGLSWQDTTPDYAPPLSRCSFAHGRMAVAGAEGFLALQ